MTWTVRSPAISYLGNKISAPPCAEALGDGPCTRHSGPAEMNGVESDSEVTQYGGSLASGTETDTDTESVASTLSADKNRKKKEKKKAAKAAAKAAAAASAAAAESAPPVRAPDQDPQPHTLQPRPPFRSAA